MAFRGFKKFFKKVGRGIKKETGKIKKGVKNVGREINRVSKNVENAMDRAGFKSPLLSKAEQREFNRKNKGRTGAGKLLQAFGSAATRGFQNVQAPAKLIRDIDPLKNTKVGKAGFSPIGLAGDIIMGVPSSIGVIGESITNKKLRKKIAKGDSDAIMNLAFSPLALAGGSIAGSSAKSAAAAGAKAGGKAAAKASARGLGKQIGKTALRGTMKIQPKSLIKQGASVAGSIVKN